MTDPEIQVVDNRLSIQAVDVPLSRLLHLLDEATGMTSKVPPQLANREISVRFTNLDLNDAVQKIFEGQPLNYVYVQGESIIVTGTAQAINLKNNPAPPPAAVAPDNANKNNAQSPIPPGQNQPSSPVPANAPQNPPANIRTPSGAVANSQATQPAQQPPAPPAATPAAPGIQNPFTTTLPGFMAPNTMLNNPAPNAGNPTQPANPSPPPVGNTPSSYPNTVPNNGFPSIVPNMEQPRINP